jgi:hypothetical protein
MNREFFFYRTDRRDHAELSCEQLYKIYLDSSLDGTTWGFFQNLQESLASVKVLHVTGEAWLSCDELKPLVSILAAFRAGGGRIQYEARSASAKSGS